MIYKKVTEKEALRIRIDIFIQNIVPILEEKGFVKSPFKTGNFGCCSNNRIFIYDMCRLCSNGLLEFVTTKISGYDRYMKIYINAFKLHPNIQSLYELKEIDDTLFHVYPNNKNEMWIDIDFIAGSPLFSKDFWFNCLKLKKSFTERGLKRKIEEIRKKAIAKAENIDMFFGKWYDKHHPNVTTWNGEPYDNKTIL